MTTRATRSPEGSDGRSAIPGRGLSCTTKRSDVVQDMELVLSLALVPPMIMLEGVSIFSLVSKGLSLDGYISKILLYQFQCSPSLARDCHATRLV